MIYDRLGYEMAGHIAYIHHTVCICSSHYLKCKIRNNCSFTAHIGIISEIFVVCNHMQERSRLFLLVNIE